MFTKGFWKWVLVGGLVSSTFLGAKAQSIKELEKDCQSGNPFPKALCEHSLPPYICFIILLHAG